MSLAFSRSQRALSDDRQRMPLAVLLVALIVLAAWAGWFFLARVPLYTYCGAGAVGRDGLALVECSPDALARIRPGQPATLMVRRPGMPTLQLPAKVIDIPSPYQRLAEWGMVKLYVFPTNEPLTGVLGDTRIEVDRLSPATLMMRNA